MTNVSKECGARFLYRVFVTSVLRASSPILKSLSFRSALKAREEPAVLWSGNGAGEALLRLHHGEQEPRILRRRDRLSDGTSLAAQGGEGGAFTRKYRMHRLVYFHSFQNVGDAIARETEITAWRREKKVALIRADNPTWEDLAEGWGGPAVMRVSGTAGSSPDYRPVRNDKTLGFDPVSE
jgi:hypothetical protein